MQGIDFEIDDDFISKSCTSDSIIWYIHSSSAIDYNISINDTSWTLYDSNNKPRKKFGGGYILAYAKKDWYDDAPRTVYEYD